MDFTGGFHVGDHHLAGSLIKVVAHIEVYAKEAI
jgi:hypothetical protein